MHTIITNNKTSTTSH